MSRLEELIQELCPDGVEYKTLGDIALVTKLAGFEFTNYVSYSDEGKIIALRGLNVKNGHLVLDDVKYIDNSDFLKLERSKLQIGDMLFTYVGTIGQVALIDENDKYYLAPNVALIRCDQEKLYPRFMMYYFQSNQFWSTQINRLLQSSSMKNIPMEKIRKFKIPVPPLPVQREIVRILDNFTELTAELTAELIARKKQYEFYRDKLLSFENVQGGATSDVVWKKLKQIADIGTGSSNTNEALEDGLYPLFVCSQEPLRKNEYEFDEVAIITAGDGVGVGKVYHFVEGKYALHQRAYRIHINTPDVLPKYFFHYMKAMFLPYIQKTMFQGSVSSIRRPMLNEFPVPIPSFKVQERLVYVLDNFEAICSDLNIGLPAEIEARQKQYEYYRDALLTFAETGKTILTDRHNGLILLCQYVFGVAVVELGLIGKVSMCKRIMKAETSATGDVPFFKIGTFEKEPDSYISREKFEEYKASYPYPNKGDILISAAGTIGRTVVFDGEDAYYQDSNIVWIANDESIALNRYLYYCYQLQPWNVSTGGTIARLYNDNISKAKIYIPSIKDQKRIISVLDRFDALCSDISSGLPAEIEARQKQYEYYRDKLLTFKEQ